MTVQPSVEQDPFAAALLPRPVPWGGVVARLRGSTALRRVVPLQVAVAGTRLVYLLAARLRPDRLVTARAAMAAVVVGTPQEGRLEELTRRHAGARAEAVEFNWRPWRLARIPVDGLDRILDARASGRGTVISFVHLGPMNGRTRLGRMLAPVHVPVGSWVFEDPPAGYPGYRLEYVRRLTRDAGQRMVTARGSRAALTAVLADGGIVMLAMDLPGSTTTTFLGKHVQMASGSARMACDTDAVVVPVALLPGPRSRWRIEVGEPLDPRAFESWTELHQALADWHSARILQAPEHYEDPVRPGAWTVADGSGWRGDPAPPVGITPSV